MEPGGVRPAHARHAPRLRADESIASLFTRVGRFARIDPARPRALPGWPRTLGVLAWAALTGGVGYAAWRRHHEQPEPPG